MDLIQFLSYTGLDIVGFLIVVGIVGGLMREAL